MFPPAAKPDHRGTVVEGEKTAAVLIRESLAYMSGLLHEGRGHSSWPRLDFVRFDYETVN